MDRSCAGDERIQLPLEISRVGAGNKRRQHNSAVGANRDNNASEERDDRILTGSLRGPVLVMAEQAAEPGLTDDLLSRFQRGVGFNPCSAERAVAEHLMRTERIVEVDVRRNQEIKVLLSEYDKMVQALEFDRLDPALNINVLIGSTRRGGDDSRAGIFQDVVEFGNEHAIAVASDVVDAELFNSSVFEKRLGLLCHPLGVWLERAGRAIDAPCGHMDERQHEALPQASGRPDTFAEEIDLPEGLGVDFQELVPRALPALGPRQHTLLLEDVLDRRFRDHMNPQLFELAENPAVAPASFFGDTDYDLTNGLQRFRASHLFRFSASALRVEPALIGSRMNNRDQLSHAGTDGRAQLEKPFALDLREEDSLLGDTLAKHFILGLEEFNLTTEPLLRGSGQQEQKRVKQPSHGDKILAENHLQEGDYLFTPPPFVASQLARSSGEQLRCACHLLTGSDIRRQNLWQY